MRTTRTRPPEAVDQPEYLKPLPPRGKRKRRLISQKHNDSGMDAWLITYADMITLLLCFFLILMAVSKPSTERLQEAVKRMKEEFKIQTGVLPEQEQATKEPEPKVYPYRSVLPAFDSIIFLNRLQQQMTLESTEEGVTIEFKNGALYDSGKAELTDAGKQILTQLVEAIRSSGIKDYRMVVEGHTDNVAVSGKTYPSNWELSALRAAGVVRFLAGEGIPQNQLEIAAFGDTRPKEPNADKIGRPIPANQAANRRTLIRILKPEGL